MGRSVETGNSKTIATIHYAGDSTVQFNCIDTYPQTGLGQVLPRFLKDEYKVVNHGKNGRSTKSFIDEGRLKVIESQISKGDFLFIQFGHNDEKKQDQLRYTNPFNEYKDNLKIFIEMALEHGALPILITPLERCHFDEGRLYNGEHSDYVKAMKEVGQEMAVPVIDLNADSRKFLDECGEEKALPFFMPDRTHMTMEGAVCFCHFIAKGLISLGGIYKNMIIDELN